MGPYRVLKLYDTGVDIRLISKPFAKPIWIALGRVRLCPAEIPDRFELPISGKTTNDKTTCDSTEDVEVCVVDKNTEKLEQKGKITERRLPRPRIMVSLKTMAPYCL